VARTWRDRTYKQHITCRECNQLVQPWPWGEVRIKPFHHKVRHCCISRPLYRLKPRSYYFDVYQTIPQLSNLRFLQPDLCLSTHCRCRGLPLHLITLSDILGRNNMGEGSDRGRDLYLHNIQHSRETNHALSGIRTRNPSKRAAADLSLRTRGRWDRLA